MPVIPAMVTVSILIAIDLVMGLIASKKKGIKIESKRLKNTAVKMLVYQLLIISGFLIESHLLSWLPITKMILGFLGVIELLSIGENFTKITGIPFIKYLRRFLRKKLNSTDFEIEDKNKGDK